MDKGVSLHLANYQKSSMKGLFKRDNEIKKNTDKLQHFGDYLIIININIAKMKKEHLDHHASIQSFTNLCPWKEDHPHQQISSTYSSIAKIKKQDKFQKFQIC